MKSVILFALLPLCSLVFVLLWAYLVARRRNTLNVTLKGFGLNLAVEVKQTTFNKGVNSHE